MWKFPSEEDSTPVSRDESLINLVDLVCSRPGMYLGDYSLLDGRSARRLMNFLLGADMTQVCLRKLDPYMNDFDAWMKQETGMNSAYSAIQQRFDEDDDDRAAFEWFVEKFREYQRTAAYRASWTDDEPGGLSGAETEPAQNQNDPAVVPSGSLLNFLELACANPDVYLRGRSARNLILLIDGWRSSMDWRRVKERDHAFERFWSWLDETTLGPPPHSLPALEYMLDSVGDEAAFDWFVERLNLYFRQSGDGDA